MISIKIMTRNLTLFERTFQIRLVHNQYSAPYIVNKSAAKTSVCTCKNIQIALRLSHWIVYSKAIALWQQSQKRKGRQCDCPGRPRRRWSEILMLFTKYLWDPLNQIDAWQVIFDMSTQLGCVDTSQIWTRQSIAKQWFQEMERKRTYTIELVWWTCSV